MSKKIYVLVAYSSDGRLYDLGYSPSLKEVRKAVNSEMFIVLKEEKRF